MNAIRADAPLGPHAFELCQMYRHTYVQETHTFNPLDPGRRSAGPLRKQCKTSWSYPSMGFAVRVRSAGQKYGPTCHQRDRADVTEFVTLVRLSSLGQHVGVLALAGYKRRKSALTAGPIAKLPNVGHSHQQHHCHDKQQRIFSPIVLKRAGVETKDLVKLYTTFVRPRRLFVGSLVRPVVEYATP